jgi:signal transduction histidine kinase
VAVSILEGPESVTVTIKDDGRGFDPDEHMLALGLLGMRERAELLGGRILIQSAPGAGTTITAVLPVQRRESRRDVA